MSEYYSTKQLTYALRDVALSIGNTGHQRSLLPLFFYARDYELRRRACSAARKLRDPSIVQFIEPCLKAIEPQVRQYALGAVYYSNCRIHLDLVRQMLITEDKHYNRELCQRILNAFEENQSLHREASLMHADDREIDNPTSRLPPGWCRHFMHADDGEIDNPPQSKATTYHKDSDNLLIKKLLDVITSGTSSDIVIAEAAASLGKQKASEAVKTLSWAIYKYYKDIIAEKCIWALAQINSDESIDALGDILIVSNNDSLYQCMAAKELGTLKSEKAINFLGKAITLYKYSRITVVNTCASVLLEVDNKEILDILAEHYLDTNYVRHYLNTVYSLNYMPQYDGEYLRLNLLVIMKLIRAGYEKGWSDLFFWTDYYLDMVDLKELVNYDYSMDDRVRLCKIDMVLSCIGHRIFADIAWLDAARGSFEFSDFITYDLYHTRGNIIDNEKMNTILKMGINKMLENVAVLECIKQYDSDLDLEI